MIGRIVCSTVRVLILSAACAGLARHAGSQDRPPDFRVQIWGDISVEFSARIRSYADLRSELERGLPPAVVTEDAAAIVNRTRALAKRMRTARAQARPGDIFTPAAGEQFRKALQLQTDGATCAALFDDNPGSSALPINGTYPTHHPLSTMPPNVLAALPPLPKDVEYRFAGRELFLLDTRANIVIDRLPSATVCRQGRTR